MEGSEATGNYEDSFYGAARLRQEHAEISDNRPHYLRIDGTGESGKVSDRVIRGLSALMPERRAGPIATTEKS